MKKVRIFVAESHGCWRIYFRIGVQSFYICEIKTKSEATWYCKCLKAAFKTLLSESR